jgi:ABC-2 type transport system permease protein
MKLIFSVAKNEFRYLFYSPIAWFVLIVFLVQGAIFYTGSVSGITNFLEVMAKNDPSFKRLSGSLTSNIFLKSEFFTGINKNLFLFIPIITMGLISREANIGTNLLLNSSPISLRKIILGKYLGIMLYNLLLVLIVIVFLTTGFFNIQHADYGPLFSAALGFYLLVCAYSAIGLFMSALSTYQVVSALSSFTIIFVLSHIGELWQRYDFVRDLTYFLSLQNRTLKMLSGLLVTKDVIYFILVTFMFVAFTLIKLRNNRESKPWYIKTGRYLAILVVVLAIGYTTSLPAITGYWDTTATKRNTIHPKTQNILREFGDSTLEITLYTNLLGAGLNLGMPEMRNASYLADLWEPFLRFKPDIKFKYEYYYDTDPSINDSSLYKGFPSKSLKEIAAETADANDANLSMFKSPEEMHKTINLQPEAYRLVMQLKYRGRTVFLRTYDDPYFWPDETNINAALKNVLGTKMPNIAFTTGELERSIIKTGEREYAFHSSSKKSRGGLVNIGFEVDTVNLAIQDIPGDVSAVVVADPKMDLNPGIMSKLKNYINTGGNLFIMGEPGKQYVLNSLLSQIGVHLMNGQIVQPSFDETPDKVVPYLTYGSSNLSEGLLWVRDLVNDTAKTLMPGVTGIVSTGNNEFKEDTIATTFRNKAWLKAGPVVIDSILPPFNPLEGDLDNPSFITIKKLTRKINNKEQRILVSGDADFASNMRLSANARFLMPFYNWLSYNQFPIYTPRPEPKDVMLTIGTKTAEIQKVVFVWILPSVLLLLATVILIRRKRK